MMSIEDIANEIRILLKEAVSNNLCEGVLLSGGLDTSIIANFLPKKSDIKAVTVALKDSQATDLNYAKYIASRYGINHLIHLFDEKELIEYIPKVIEIMKSFDPMEIRNSVAIFIAMKVAQDQNIKSIMTGDGSDELLAGYSFLFNLNKEGLERRLSEMWSNMSFSSIPIGKFLGIDIKLPFLDSKFMSYAMHLDSSYKIKFEKNQIWGKWILRKAFERILPEEVIWRVKTPIEYGTGTTELTKIFEKRIDNIQFKDKKMKYEEEDRVILRNKEQMHYYEIFKTIFGIPRSTKLNAKKCPFCNSDIFGNSKFCKVCGAYSI